MQKNSLISALALIAILTTSSYAGSGGGTSSITMREAICIALENNLGVRVERLEVDAAEQRIVGRRAEFDPSINASYLYESRNTPQNTREFVATQSAFTDSRNRIFSEENQRFSSGIGGRTTWGLQYELGVEVNSLKNSLNISSPPSLFYPEYESFTGLRFTQPLLKGAGSRVQLAGLRVAATDRQIADLRWRLRLQQLVAQVAKNYIDFAFTERDSNIKRRYLDMARTLESENARRMEEGVGSTLEIQQSAAAAAVREEEFTSARLLFRERMNLLKRDLLSEPDRENRIHYLPAEFPSTNVDVPSRASLEADALRLRPEILQALAEIEKQKLAVMVAENQRHPQLDLVASVGGRGLDGSVDSSLSDSVQFNQTEWTVGIVYSQPIGGRSARSVINEAKIQLQQLLLNKQQIEIDLSLQVDTALIRVNTSRERIHLTRKAIDASRQTLESEERRMEEGVGVSQNVLDAQRDLAAAETRSLAAMADLHKAIVDLRLVSGTILDEYGINFAKLPAR